MGTWCDSNNDRNERATATQHSQSTLYSSFGASSFNNKSTNLPKFFPSEECYYFKIKDSNALDLLRSNSTNPNSRKLELFFSLNNVINPKSSYSFSLTIINNANLGINSYLGDLEQRSGENIDFGNSFEIDFFPDRKQILIIKPIINKNNTNLEFKITVMDLIQKKYHDFFIPQIGTLKLTYSFLDKNINAQLEQYFSNFKFTINLYNMNQLCSQGIFFVLNQYKDSYKKRPIYKSKIYYMDMIEAKDIKIEADFLCKNLNDKISLDLYLTTQIKRPIAKGSFTLNQLISNSQNNTTEIDIIRSYNNILTGKCLINHYYIKKISFAEKLAKKNMQINLEIAIDYTKSNGDPHNPKSKHYLKPYELNDYEIAIKNCGAILAPYDADQLFPVYGFGGIPFYLNGQPNNQVSHCFNINFMENGEIFGIDNILKVYRESFKGIELSGNTKFSFVLKKVISNINYDLKNRKKENHYYILLILTDGVINDIQETKDLIVEASYLPLSIVIIGIGNEDFTNMEDLDGDENSVRNSRGEKWKRDIVQFIEFNKFKKKYLIIGTDFAEEVLKEIPRQINEYYERCGKFY